MRGHGLPIPALAAAALLSLVPMVARAFDWSGRLGLAYDRTETWSGGTYSLVPRLRLDGLARAHGFVVAPDVLDWIGLLGYASDRTTYDTATGDAKAETNSLTYALTVGALQSRTARLSLSGSASRSQSDFSNELEAGKSTGTSTVNAYSVTAAGLPPGFPSLLASYDYRDIVNSGLGRPATTETWRTLNLSTQFGQSGLNSALKYQLQDVTGSLPATNFESQHVELQGTVEPAGGVHGQVNALYFVRDPTQLSSTNPRLENTMVDCGVRWDGKSPRTVARASYRYGHAFATEPSLQERELMSHSAALQYSRPLSPEWRWIGSASAGFAERRVGDAAQSSDATQAIGLTFDFTRPLAGASLGARVGVTEPSSGSAALAYGATALVRKGWRRANQALSVSYSVIYDSNLSPAGGWSFTQALLAELALAGPGRLTYGARLQANGARAGGGAFGGNASRSIVVGGWIQHHRGAVLDLQAGTSDSVSGALANPISDALFVPAGFNTHSRFALLTGAIPLARHLSLRLLARYTVLSGPSIPQQREALVNPSLSYAVGAWTLSLDDRYTAGGATSFDRRVNELFVRASRTFGGR